MDNSVSTTFIAVQKRFRLYAYSTTVMFSTMSSFVYLPAIVSSFNILVEQVNWTITSYLTVSSIVPSIFGDMANEIGRHFVLLPTHCLYFANTILYSADSDGTHTIITSCKRRAEAETWDRKRK